jgi:hypothetical protein
LRNGTYPTHESEGVSNTFFTCTLLTDGAVRAFLLLYRPGRGQQRKMDEAGCTISTGSTPTPEERTNESERQAKKKDITYNTSDTNTPESIVLVALGSDMDGAIKRLLGGVTASLLDQAMG